MNQEPQEPEQENEYEYEHYFIRFGYMGIPLSNIVSHLDLIDCMQFASTNREIRDFVVDASKSLKDIEEKGCVDLDRFPSTTIGREEIETVYRTFPNTKKLKISLCYASNHFLDELHKFKLLEKLSVHARCTDHNRNNKDITIRSVTIRGKYYVADSDAVYAFLNQIKGTKTISLKGGIITAKTIYLLQTRNLNKLKIHNSIVRNCFPLIRYILDSTYLTVLKLTSDNYVLAPQAIMVASDVITRLPYGKQLVLREFTFTVDLACRIPYENLIKLPMLEKLTLYYSVQERTHNIDKLIELATQWTHLEITFIEYFDKNRVLGRERFEILKRKSFYYKTIIETTGPHVRGKPMDFDLLRRDPQLIFIN